ncbi:MAG: class I SAM-dependent DNA methyltransferase [Selenomonadaceae bacterium]|nr:class I SAM-dependent DNA methyltransferase [Selenomonadaceae bacterium]
MSQEAAKIFANDWYELGDEKSDTQKFWWTLLRDVFDIERPEKLIDFEISVPNGFIDAYIASTKVLIEQKSFGVDLSKKILQSDGKFLTPYEQAERYAQVLSEKPRWIVTCNFSEFRIYKNGRDEPTIIKLRDLRYQFPRLKFLIDPTADDSPPEEKISAEALAVIEKIYDAFAKNYERNKISDYEDALNKICTRLVFCLYAGDAQLFDANQFFNYLQSFSDAERNFALQNLFNVLNTPENQRDDFDDALKSFPYVNGGLFDEKISLPEYNKNVGNPTAAIGAFNARKKFSWHEISPPIFGAMFESTFSKENRQRASGMFYTSVENIHKVIDPLFMDDLRDEFELAKRKQIKNRAAALLELQNKLAALKFLDPACGSGNFLTETFISLRRLENEILEELRPLINLPENPVKVSINQFYGIEINSFAVAVAQTALWIAENQMLQETEGALGKNLQALPLKNFSTIVKANALQIDWKKIVRNVDFIIGNPPFVGARLKSAEQARDLQKIFDGWKNLGNLDYVCAWYKKSADFMANNSTRAALVSTNSVCQGDSVGTLWKNLFKQGIHIDFAHRTFKWLSDSENMAHVHCVVVGFSSAPNKKPKIIFDGGKIFIASNINAYLVDGDDIFVESRPNPLQNGVPEIGIGNKPIDGGNYLFTPEEMDDFIKLEPESAKFFKPWFGAEEFIKGKRRFCLLLKDLPPEEIKKHPLIAERVENVKNYRLASKSAGTRKISDKPIRFHVENFPRGNFILVPRHSAGARKYIPFGFLSPKVIAGDSTLIIRDAEIYHFGILTSSIHMAWTKTFCGYLGTSYRYSKDVVYNNFPWCAVTERRRRMIERTAQNILDVRADFPDWTFAKLYDEATMPDELRLAHKANDYAVALAYGFEEFFMDEARVVAELMKLYKALTKT